MHSIVANTDMFDDASVIIGVAVAIMALIFGKRYDTQRGLVPEQFAKAVLRQNKEVFERLSKM